MLITTTDVSSFKEAELRQEEAVQRLQAAFDQTRRRMWEVDLNTGLFRAYGRDGQYRPLGEGGLRFPNQLVEEGWVHPSSVLRFRAFAGELLGGRARGYGNFAIRDKDSGFYSWAAVSYRMMFDDVGRAVRAVGEAGGAPLPGFCGLGGFGWAARWRRDRERTANTTAAAIRSSGHR